MSWLIITIFLSSILCISSQHHPTNPSPYEALKQYNFPAGLLPEGVTGYTLNETSGEFSARLSGQCTFALENSSYTLRYDPVIEGLISDGRLTKLSGVSVRVVLLWLNIVEVKRNDGNLEFSVGFKSADFPVENFEECPKCGCGFECGNRFFS